MNNYIKDYAIYVRLNENLNNLFNIECPETSIHISTDKNEIIAEFKKWYDFWNSKIVDLDLNDMINHKKNKLVLMKNQICEEKLVYILKELDKIQLRDEFIKLYK